MYKDKLLKLKQNNERILLIGFGQEIKQFYNWLLDVVEFNPDNIVVADKNSIVLENSKVVSGENYLNALDDDFGMVFKAPGIWSLKPELVAYRARNGEDSVLSSLIFFLEEYRDDILMITGTKGKTTTSTWSKHFLKNSNITKEIEYCGNTTNISPYQFWTKFNTKLDDIFFVIEISSFQLQDLGFSKISPKYAIITNLYIDHLDQHNNKNEYWNAKDNIFKYQKTTDYLVLTKQVFDNLIARKVNLISKLKIIKESDILDFKINLKSNLIGDHNWSNMIEAYYLSSIIAKINNLQDTIFSFEPPKGRLELITKKTIGNTCVSFYNDNTATEPDAVVAALDALSNEDNSKTILIISGKWKNGNHDKLADKIKELVTSSKLLKVYYFGEVGQKLFELINGNSQEFISFKSWLNNKDDFLNYIMLLKEENLNLLFSPSGSSFDEFKNYIERGDLYLDWISRL
jgi:UDP-N-acetylmuramoylalanine-D-glutamate ligase